MKFFNLSAAREGLPDRWNPQNGDLFMLPEKSSRLQGDQYVYMVRECLTCGAIGSHPWPMRGGLFAVCKRCGEAQL